MSYNTELQSNNSNITISALCGIFCVNLNSSQVFQLAIGGASVMGISTAYFAVASSENVIIAGGGSAN